MFDPRERSQAITFLTCRAIIAGAHHMLVVVYFMLKRGVPCDALRLDAPRFTLTTNP
jgi:hypothetical protein